MQNKSRKAEEMTWCTRFPEHWQGGAVWRLSRWQVFKIFWGDWCKTLRTKRPANGEQRTWTMDRAFHSRLEGVAEQDSRPGADGRAELSKHQWGSSTGRHSRAEEDNLTY